MQYFRGTALSGSPVVAGCDADINQSFTPGTGPAGVGAEQYSARWIKTVGSGKYTFTARADDGIRIKIDGETVLNQWVEQSANSDHSADVQLTDELHTVAVEYFQAYGDAVAVVSYTKDGADSESPIAPKELIANGGPSSVDLGWKASRSRDVAGYRVFRGTASGVDLKSEPLTGNETLTGTSFSDVSAQPGITYYYSVVAVDSAGNVSAGSNEAAGLLADSPARAATEAADTTPPPAPGALTAVSGDTKVTLGWTAPAAADLAGYRVYRSLQPVVGDTGSLLSGDALVTGTSYVDNTATNGTTYFYMVTAVDLSANESGPSNEVHAVPVTPNTTNIKVDFTTASGVPASGYTADWGQSFAARTSPNQGTGLTYGWKTPDGNPLSLVGNGRDRGRAGIDERLDSILHMQYGDESGTNGIKTEGIWEASVPEGLYRVTIAVGDQAFAAGYNSVHALNVEAGVGIERFQGTAGQEYQTATVVVGVWDGALTITAAGGTNTKIAYVDIIGIERAPHVDTMRPDNRSTGQDPTDGVSATIRVPYAGVGVDASTLPGNVHIYEVATGAEVPSSTGTSGGNDVIATQANAPLKSGTTYRFVVTSNVKDNYGASFVPFTSVFTTGMGGTTGGANYTPLTGVSFDKVEQPVAAGKYWSSMAFGPDGKMYASTIGQGIFRFTVAADGTLSNIESLGYEGRAIIGLVFDKTGTASNPKLWITSTSANTFNEQGEWISGVSMLSGASLQTESKVFTGLPRSQADHLTNSMAYGPDGRLYFMQGSNQGAGDLDNSWGQRGEKLLTAATLVFDPADAAVQQAISSGSPINVQTSGGGSYNPYASGAPLKIYATGIRNAYDLVWHSNGHLYVPTNGTAGGANSPGVTKNSNGTYTRVAAAGIPGYSSVNGQDVTMQCLRRGYTGGSVPAIGNQPTQRDFLFDVVQGGYYGHPNPERCEWVLNEGNDPANPPVAAGQGGTKYPSGTKADPNYRGFGYDLGFNKSPNGSIEYKSNAFGGQLKGRLIVTRFSNNNDLLFLQMDPATGKVIGEQTSLGITGVPNSEIGNVDGFNDPLEVVEDPKTGNLYVNQYDRSGSNQAMFLLRVPGAQQAAPLTSSAPEMIFSAVKSTTGPTKSVTVTNTGSTSATLSTTITGANPTEFTTAGGNGTTLAPGASTTVQATFKPGTTVGQRQAILRISAGGNALDVGLYGLTMNGIEGLNEPTFQDVVGTLGYNINVGWSNLEGGTQATAKGEELLEPLFLKAGTGAVSMTPLAQYAPKEDLPFGWYTGDGMPAQQHKLGSIDISGYQSLLPPSSPGTVQTFDPGSQSFGFYYYSNAFQRTGYTEDRLNIGGVAHRARVYAAKNRAGAPIANSYIVAFEDASNGDYQDYVFLVQGVRPASGGPGGPTSGAMKVNFSNLAAGLPTGYVRDFGEPFSARTRTDQGMGLSYGWKSQATGAPIDLSTAGTAGPGNGRLRSTTQPDLRLNTLMHMQSADVTGFNGVSTYAFWEAAVPNGDYDVTVAVGDAAPQTATELHTINLEGKKIIDRFAPSGASGTGTRHNTAVTRVTVTDGLLTVDAQGGINTKINYIDIAPAATDPGGDPTVGAQVKINFQTAGTPTPAGWTPDTGAAYLAQRKFGWLVGTTPTDRSAATRYRTAATSGISYPSDVRLQSLNIMGPASNVTTGVWEYDVPNGTYSVAASAGDAGYLDSSHGILAEGQPLIASFVPTGTAPFQTGERQITVADGKLTLSSSGTNTKINWVSIKGEGLDTQPDTVPTAKYNFTLPGTTTPSGWIADNGGMYDADGFGWLVGGTPTDRTLEARNRPSATAGITYPTDPLLQSLVQMQTAYRGGTDGVWQRAIPNGSYEVTASVGDAGYLDSTHALNVEGTELISPFTPTGATPFKSGTATVDVTDGMLTLTPTGANTKINWVTIKGASVLNPVITVTVNGQTVSGDYNGGQATVSLASQASAGAQITALSYELDGVTANYSGPFVIGTGNHTLAVTATDDAGRTTVHNMAFNVQDVGGTLTLSNSQATRRDGLPIPGFSEDWLVMHRLNSGVDQHKVTDTGTVQLTNTGTQTLMVNKLVITGTGAAGFSLVSPPALPLTIDPGASVPLTAKFIETAGSKGIRTAQLEITSSDTATAVKTVQLRGAYMSAPEANNELSLKQLAQAFGITTDFGTLKAGDELPSSALNGEEVRSGLWNTMDPGKPVTVRQLAAFHSCCTAGETISVAGTSADSSGLYGQTILPLNAAQTGPTELDTMPAGPFGIVVANQSTENAQFLSIKTWPVRDRNGQLLAGNYVVGHDYMSAANQCASGPANCDYQDNVYLITNVVPTSATDSSAPAAPTGLTATAGTDNVTLNWTANTEPDLAGYHLERATDPAGTWTRLTGTTPVTATNYTDTTPPVAQAVHYRVLAIDTSANVSAPSTPATTDTSATTAQPVRIDTGGPGTTTDGTTWLADAYFTGGKTFTNPQITDIAGTTADALYLNERSGPGGFGYAIPLAAGNYTVKLHFAELWHGATGGGPGGTGKRVFNVNLEAGTPEITNLDLNAAAGPMTAHIITQQLNVNDGTLNIDFTATTDEPTISAIEIIPESAVDSSVPAAPTGLTATAGTDNVTLNWTANTEPDLAGYHVERATDPAGTWTRLTGTAPVTTTNYTDTTPPVAQAVHYRVLAIDTSANVSAPSTPATTSTTDTSPPPAPVAAKRLNDFNGDSKTDLIARDSTGQLWLYPGTGTGDWFKRIDLGSGWNTMTSIVTPGDFDSDGKADLIARDNSGELWLYPGTGTGDWSQRESLGSGWNVMTSIVGPGDFNGDGRPDLIARDSSGELWLYPNNGAGDWFKRIDLGPGWNIMSSIVAPGDFDADGRVDLLARDTKGRFWLYPGNGSNEWFTRVSLGGGWNTLSAITAPGDLNSDGRPDVIARDTTGELWLYPNNGAGDWFTRIDLGPGWNQMTAIL